MKTCPELDYTKANPIVLNRDFLSPTKSNCLDDPSCILTLTLGNATKVEQDVLEIRCCVSRYECAVPFFNLPCFLADCWQTQSLCYHRELMKRTLGKPTHAFEARAYVVSLPVLQECSHSQATNPLDSAKTGDTGAAGTLPSH